MTLIALALLYAAHAEDLPMPAEAPGTTAIDSAVEPIATRYTGQLIALRTLSAGRGALPDENLEPLLRVQQDGRYNPQDVRQDLAMLYRVAHVVQVRVDVEPWPAFDEDGNLVPAVHVDYTIFPPDPVHRLKIAGNAHIDGRELQSAMRLTRESPWFPEDVPRLMASIQSAYIERGWPNANANIVATPRTRPDGTSDGVDVQSDIDEGTGCSKPAIASSGDGIWCCPDQRASCIGACSCSAACCLASDFDCCKIADICDLRSASDHGEA